MKELHVKKNGPEIELALADWRREHERNGLLSAERLDELQDHVHEGALALASRGLAADECVWLSARRLGSVPDIAHEFDRARPSLAGAERALAWMICGVLAWLVVAAVARTLFGLVQVVALEAAPHWPALPTALATATLAIAGWSLVLAWRRAAARPARWRALVRRPWLVGVSVLGIMGLCNAASIMATIRLTRVGTPTQTGELIVAQVWSELALQFCAPIVMVVVWQRQLRVPLTRLAAADA